MPPPSIHTTANTGAIWSFRRTNCPKGCIGLTESNLGQLTPDSDHADPNGLALTFRILQPRLLRLFLFLERLRQRRKLTADILEEEPPLNDSGHESL
jgi:hypothetical protein